MKTRHGHTITGRGILFGMPVYITDDACTPENLASALVLSLFIGTLGFDGHVMAYEGVGYWTALWWWLSNTGPESEP